MRILVTGGTGFVGSHTVAQLVKSGHEVRLLVRSPQRIKAALAPLGIPEQPYAAGDVTEPETVEQAMQGCDAVLHAASIYSLDARSAGLMRQVNSRGTDIVLGAACRLGLDPIVYVSSIVALFPPGGQVLNINSPVKQPPGAYYRSKADSESIARNYQETGAPVVISYPGGVYGPDDPHFGESGQLIQNLLKGRIPAISRGGLSLVDVRDVAQAHAAMMERGRGPRRYMMSGTHIAFNALIEDLARLTGRQLRYFTFPSWFLWPVVRSAGLLQRFLPFRLPLSTEGFYFLVWNPHGDDTEARADLGFAPRNLQETLTDMVRWMYETGRITAREAGKLASPESQ